jgi:phosphoenolpyruvate carboxylase
MKIDVTQIIVVVITALIIPFVKKYIVPFIQAKVNSWKSNLTTNQWNLIKELIVDAVKAAQSMSQFQNLENAGAAKFAYVLQCIKTACENIGVTYDEDTIKNCIQSVWHDLFNAENPAATEISDEEKRVAIAAKLAKESQE